MNVRWAWMALAVIAAAACEREEPEQEQQEGRLTLSVETPEMLDWGSMGSLRLTLGNEGEVAAQGAFIEVYLPAWLEFDSVEPAGTAVTVVSGDAETRLVYHMTDTLPAGERRTIIQHLRVPYQPPATAPVNDTIPTIQLAPTNRVVRARLVTPRGEPAGAEVQATLNFVGSSMPLPAPAPPPDTGAAGDTTAAGRPRTQPRDTTGARLPTPPRTASVGRTSHRYPPIDASVQPPYHTR